MPRRITSRTSIETLRKEAKRWLKALRSGVAAARARFERALADAPAMPTLRDVQHALAREYGLPGWNALKDQLARDAYLRRYERVAEALVTAFHTGESSALRIVWEYFGHMRAWPAMQRYVRLDLGRTEEPAPGSTDTITLDEAKFLVARAQGFESWNALASYAATIPADGALPAEKAVRLYMPSAHGEHVEAARTRDWDEAITLLRERQLTGFHPSGQMTDALLERISRLEHITALDLDGSKQVSDEGLRWLARLPHLTHLNLAGCSITDRGLEVLRQMPALESIVLAWTRVTDHGAAHLAACEQLERVDLGGTMCGDGTIRALAGKRRLRDLRTGNAVTDEGLAALRDLPVFRAWQGARERMMRPDNDAAPSFLALRGPFTDRGFTYVGELAGLYALNVDSSQLAITGQALVPLVNLPHLELLSFDAKDESMPHIAALPHLRFLMCQDTSAGDDGFVALSRSQSIEHIWGRRCHNLQRRGFVALAELPALRYLSVSCKNVDDVGVSALPRFPALRELMPMDVPDEGYRHIGRCEKLESLVLMYCRDTGDRATERLTGLPNLRKYFASYNRITDRTPELLATMVSLEEITFDTCAGLTDAGVGALARLPNLTRLNLSGMPNVTEAVKSAFPARVNVRWNL